MLVSTKTRAPKIAARLIAGSALKRKVGFQVARSSIVDSCMLLVIHCISKTKEFDFSCFIAADLMKHLKVAYRGLDLFQFHWRWKRTRLFRKGLQNSDIFATRH